MKFIIMLFFFSLLGLFLLSLIFIFTSKIKESIQVKNPVPKKIKFTDIIKDSFNKNNTHFHSINLNDSLSITQYGNELLKEFGKLSDLMLFLSQNSFIEEANLNIKDIISHKGEKIDDLTFDKFNFISHFTKNKLLEQVSRIQKNIPNIENKLNDFDKAIENANKAISNIKFLNSKKSSEIHNDMTLKSNGILLKSKIDSLVKSKIYYEQSIIQLKTILHINNNVIISFDEIIHNVLPLIKNKKTLDSIKSISFDNMIKDLQKLKDIKIIN